MKNNNAVMVRHTADLNTNLIRMFWLWIIWTRFGCLADLAYVSFYFHIDSDCVCCVFVVHALDLICVSLFSLALSLNPITFSHDSVFVTLALPRPSYPHHIESNFQYIIFCILFGSGVLDMFAFGWLFYTFSSFRTVQFV